MLKYIDLALTIAGAIAIVFTGGLAASLMVHRGY